VASDASAARPDDGIASDALVNAFVDQVFLLARRSVVRTARQPANVISPLLFPMLLLAVNAGGLKAETQLPGFPTTSFAAVALAALRTGSGEAVQGLFPVFFVFLFISSMNIPRNLMEITWFRDVATANPVSYLLECVRSLVITGWNGEALALGFGVTAAITVIS